MNRFLIVAIALFISFNATAETNISGYFNMERIEKKGSPAEFDLHHINLMLQHETDDFKVFSEIEYEHATALEANDDYDNAGTDDEFEERRGAIIVERAWVEWEIDHYLTFKTGLMLNNTLYQQNHYPNIINNISRPQIVKNIFDNEIEGIQFYGKAQGIVYDYWHRRGPNEGALENDGVSTGYSVGYHYLQGDWDVTLRYLSGKYTVANSDDTATDTEIANGIELNLVWNNVSLWMESGSRDKTGSGTDRSGTYAIFSYAIELDGGKEIVPYYMHDTYKDESSMNDYKQNCGMGFAYRPKANVAIKLEYLTTAAYDDNSGVEVEETHKWSAALAYFFN